jgi:hypothetical protein
MGQVITANRLRDGVVVFLGAGTQWVEHLRAAQVFATPDAVAAGLADAKQSEDDNLVLDIYAIDVSEKDGVVTPARLREAIRASGPTIHPEHGKSPAQNRG